MEVYTLSGLTYTIPPTTGLIEFSGNSIPIQFTKGSGSVFSPDVLTLNSDNISSGRRKLGMLAYVYETNKIYQFRIDNYETLWNNATGATGPGGSTVVISDFGTTVKNNSPEGQSFINVWTASTISGIDGYDDTNASWRVLSTGGSGGASITGGTFDNSTDTLTLNNSTGGTITITGFTDIFVTGGTYSAGTTTFTNNTGGTFNVTGFYVPPTPPPPDKIILKKIDLGTRYIDGGSGDVVGNLNNVFIYRLTDGILGSDLQNNYTAVKIDYFITYDNPKTGIRTKELFITQKINVDLDSYTTFSNIRNYIYDNYSARNVNFYCEMYLELNSDYSAPTQVRLTNTLFNSLNPYKYSRSRNYQGRYEFVRSNYNLPIPLNSIESNFTNKWVNYYEVSTSEDIVRNVYSIITEPTFYGSLSEQSQTAITPILYSDGSIDGTFVYGSGFDFPVYTIAIQSDNKILVGGNFSDYNGAGANGIIRLNTDGSVDGTFVYGSGFNASVNIIVIQSDNKILVGGVFTDYNGTGANRIIRLNSDGSVDGTFVYGTGFDNFVSSIVVQSDNKILVGGRFNNYNGNVSNSIIRLNTDGSVDNTFNIGSGFTGSSGVVYDIKIQSDNKILVGGSFTNYQGTGTNRIIRLNSDGSIDGTFVYGSGFNASVNTIVIQSDNKILVGGSFTTYDTTSKKRIVRLNSDGSVDGTFGSISGEFSSSVNTIVIQSDNKILVGGDFVTYEETASNKIIRLSYVFTTEIRETIKNSVFVETLTDFYSKFRIPVNEHKFFKSCDLLYNNFYGEILYDIVGGSNSTISSYASIDGTNSTSFYQMIDTYRLYPGGTPGVIFNGDSLNDSTTNLNDLSYSMGIDRELKYINKKSNSYIQVLPYYQDIYILKLSVVGGPGNTVAENFITNLVNNYLQVNDSSLKNNNKYWYHGNELDVNGLYYLSGQFEFENNPYGPYLVIQSTDEKMYQLSQNPIYVGGGGSIYVDAIYKGTSFKPSLYPLNLNQLTLEVPVTETNNEFYMDGKKQLRLIVKYTKLQKYDIITTEIVATTIRASYDNKFFTITTDNQSFENLIYTSISNGKRKQLRPGSVEIYLSFFDSNTGESSIIPNYKIIITKYGDNEIFKLIRGL